MGLISIAMGLAQVIPSIVGMFKGKDAEQQAENVVGIAKKITGIDDPQKAVDAVVAPDLGYAEYTSGGTPTGSVLSPYGVSGLKLYGKDGLKLYNQSH